MGKSKQRSQAATEYANLKPEERLGDGPVEVQYLDQMKQVSQVIDLIFNDPDEKDKKTGFVLMVFPFGDSRSRVNFMSNGADRSDVVALMKEVIARFEGQPEMSGSA